MPLTTEQLKKHFKSNFDLAMQAIQSARYLIKSGHEVKVDELLANIAKNPEQWRPDMLEALDKAEQEEESKYDDEPNRPLS